MAMSDTISAALESHFLWSRTMYGMESVERILVLGIVVVIVAILGIAVWGAAQEHEERTPADLQFAELGWVPEGAVLSEAGRVWIDPHAQLVPVETRPGWVLIEHSEAGYGIHLTYDNLPNTPLLATPVPYLPAHIVFKKEPPP